MTAPADVPVRITPEAAARAAELGMQTELERMITHAREAIPDLRRLDVVLAEPYDTGSEPGINLYATSAHPCPLQDETSWEWDGWMIETFPPQVGEHFTMLLDYEPNHAG